MDRQTIRILSWWPQWTFRASGIKIFYRPYWLWVDLYDNWWLLKAMSHDATSFMIFGFMKPVSPWDRAKNVMQGKVPCDCFYDRALLYMYSYDVFRETFPNYTIIFPIISVQWGKHTFIFSEHMVTIFTYQKHTTCTSIQYNPCVKCERYTLINIITTSKCRWKNCMSVIGNCLLCLLVNGTRRS